MRRSVQGLANQPFKLEEASKDYERDQIKIRKHSGGIKEQRAFCFGDKIVFKEPDKGQSFTKRGIVLSVRMGGKSYEIRSENKKMTVRNNKYVRKALQRRRWSQWRSGTQLPAPSCLWTHLTQREQSAAW
jgi:hypothetical protein